MIYIEIYRERNILIHNDFVDQKLTFEPTRTVKHSSLTESMGHAEATAGGIANVQIAKLTLS